MEKKYNLNSENPLKNEQKGSEPVQHRLKYDPPRILAFSLEMECSIAASSATIRPIGSDNAETLEVKNWIHVDKGDYEIDL